MKRLHIFPVARNLAVAGRRSRLLVLSGLLALAWLPAAIADNLVWSDPGISQPAPSRSYVPEPIAAPAGMPAPADERLLAPEDIQRTPHRPAAAKSPEDDASVSDPQPPRPRRQVAVAETPEDDARMPDPKLPRYRRRTAVAESPEDDVTVTDPQPATKHKRPAAARMQAVDAEPAADGPCAEEDDGTCQDRQPRYWRPGLCWQAVPGRVEARGEWLLWWGKGNYVPALVTTGPTTPANGLPAGALGASGTTVLFGDSDLTDASRSGARFTLDYWLTCDHSLGLEAQYFALGDATTNFQAASSTGLPVLARPYFDAQSGAAAATLVGFPGTQNGSVNVAAATGFQGVGALLRKTCYEGCDSHLDFLVGYRYLRLSDDLDIYENVTFTGNPAVAVGTTQNLADHFSTLNEFQGADLGFVSNWHCNRWELGFLLKVGMGDTSSHVVINGNNTLQQPAPTATPSPGGFLAQASNSNAGIPYRSNQFTMVPELGINAGFDLTPRLRLVGGYSLIYWSAVARSGDQIDLNLTYPTVAGIRSPEFRFAMSDYWAQGLNLGLDLRF